MQKKFALISCPLSSLVDVADIFYFFRLGAGEGGPIRWGRGGGGRFFIENPRRGGLPAGG